jgi:hypothetical protein
MIGIRRTDGQMDGRTDRQKCTLRKAFYLIREKHQKTYRSNWTSVGRLQNYPTHFPLRQSLPFVLDMKIVSLRESLEMAEGEIPFPAGVEIRRFNVNTLNFAAILSRLIRKSFINKDVT